MCRQLFLQNRSVANYNILTKHNLKEKEFEMNSTVLWFLLYLDKENTDDDKYQQEDVELGQGAGE